MKILTFCVFLVAKSLAIPAPFQSFSRSNNEFASDVYKVAAAETKGNFLMSPLSAQLILALSQSGARGKTALEIQKVLKLSLNKQMIDCIVVDLLQKLRRKHDFVLKTVNKIYVKSGKPLKEDFLAVAKQIYESEAENVDFSKPVEAAATINRWVEEETEGTIRDLVDPGILGNQTRAVLVNALRFRGNWSRPFEFFSTRKEEFHTLDDTIEVETMNLSEERLQYYEKPNLKATFLELPFVGENISMTIVLPKERNGLKVLEDHVDQVLEAPQAKYEELFDVALPKFKLDSRIDLKNVLKSLGVKKAFRDGKADFSLIAGEKGELFIGDVVQKTFIDVNEDGVEAAAATFVVKVANRNGDSARSFRADHPFLFFVKVDDIVVFLGRVTRPDY